MKTRCHFTLIELLVVVSIIGVLAALIIPALSTARKRSKLALCVSNLKSIGQTVSIYYSDGTEFPSIDTAVEGGDTSPIQSGTPMDIDSDLITCPVENTVPFTWNFSNSTNTGGRVIYSGEEDKHLANDDLDGSPHGNNEDKFKLQFLYQDGSVTTETSR